MSQQNQQSWETPRAPMCSRPQWPSPCPTPCPASCAPCSGGCDSASQRPQDVNWAGTKRMRRRQPRCLRGGTTYRIKEEEC
ncbi:late cornified envelope protein 6A [Erinaceus europaeus]|uniref:Late cornified envelope protein 6A n=1 Tax=Erinaceus europaeus TaxID=9365 RepID=A0ABM3Y9A4_ERIEU|nr:late cornified envelope protein 6A [Erinaceus europaeus]